MKKAIIALYNALVEWSDVLHQYRQSKYTKHYY
jgi:hypothetical protein